MNAADAFDIGSFDEDDTKKIKVSVGEHGAKSLFNNIVQYRSTCMWTVLHLQWHLFILLQLSDEDQKIYKNFNLLVPDRWQVEMMGEHTTSQLHNLYVHVMPDHRQMCMCTLTIVTVVRIKYSISSNVVHIYLNGH